MKSDVYSLGLVIWEIVTGELVTFPYPYWREPRYAILTNTLVGTPMPPPGPFL